MSTTEGDLDRRGRPLDEWASLMAIHGLNEAGLYLHLQDHGNQLRAGVAEIYIGSDLAGVRLRPGDVVTTAERVWLVGPDDPCSDGTDAPSQAEVRVYRRVTNALWDAIGDAYEPGPTKGRTPTTKRAPKTKTGRT